MAPTYYFCDKVVKGDSVDPSALGRNLAALRQSRGWSQSELARRSGVSQAFVSALESGYRRKASTDVAMALAEALGVELAELLRRTQ